MRTYALISQKGGAGKSTLALQLACKAAESGPAFVVDRDPQGTIRKWWERRQESDDAPAFPELVALGRQTLTDAVAAVRGQPGALFIDTRPAVEGLEAEAARVADVAIIPVRPSIADLEAVADTIAIIRRLERRAVLVVNAAKAEKRATEARAALGVYGVPIAPFYVADRAIYQDAQIEGRGVGEMRGSSAAAAQAEIANLWTWINEDNR